ncbi:MAG TPA: hypothetical protein VMG35_15395 [Bryobacteraceae bacterium]|nr:hypothetical protein [Bryobacteraceae bacterium]
MASFAPGGPRTFKFEQSDLKGFLDQRHKDGVCAALVIEWLAGGGDLSRQRPTRGIKTKQRIEKLQDRVMSGGIFDAFQEYGLVRAGGDDIISSEGRSTDDLVSFICGTISYYYIALNASDDVGHALGAITGDHCGKYFDPNGQESTFDRNLAQYRSTVKGALVYHQTFGLGNIIVVRLSPLAKLATTHLRRMPR